MEAIREKGGDTSSLIMLVSPKNKREITKHYNMQNGFILPASRNVGGLSIDQIVTDFGTIGLMIHDMVSDEEILFLNLGVCAIVEQPVPGKGNFFWEELARTGAGIKGHIFGQCGLDYGPEWYHAKITGLTQSSTLAARKK